MIPLGSADSERFASLLDLEDDAKEAMAEIEIEGMSPGEDIRHLNDLKVDLLEALVALTEDAFPQFTGGCVGTFDIRKGAYEKALVAIARAKGESS